MSYTLEILDEGRIVVVTLGEDFDIHTEMRESVRERLALMETGPDRVVHIIDSRNFRPANVTELIAAANQVHEAENKKLTQHPKMLKRVTITNNKLGLMAIKGMNTAAFGNLDIAVFGTLEEALAYARWLLGEAEKVG